MDTSGTLLAEDLVPNSASSPNPIGITAGPAGDQHVWYTEPTNTSGGLGNFGNALVSSGATATFFTGNANSQPESIRAIGNNLWIGLQNLNQVLIVNASGVTQGSATPPAGTGPQGLTLGPDGNVWVTGIFNGTLNAFSATNPFSLISSVTVPAGVGAEPIDIITGPDNALWFTEQIGNGTTTNIGRMPIGGPITEFPLPATLQAPFKITNGPDGGIWFTSGSNPSAHGEIVRINPTTRAFVSYPMTTTTQASFGLVTGPDGNLWATDYQGSAIVRIQP